jgi:hypothetical protein
MSRRPRSRSSRSSSSSSSSDSQDNDSDEPDSSHSDDSDEKEALSEWGLDGYMSELARPKPKRRRAKALVTKGHRPTGIGSSSRPDSRNRFDTRSLPDMLDLDGKSRAKKVNFGSDRGSITPRRSLRVRANSSSVLESPTWRLPISEVHGTTTEDLSRTSFLKSGGSTDPFPSEDQSGHPESSKPTVSIASTRTRSRATSVLDRPRPSISFDDRDTDPRQSISLPGTAGPENISRAASVVERPATVDMSRTSTDSRSRTASVMDRPRPSLSFDEPRNSKIIPLPYPGESSTSRKYSHHGSVSGSVNMRKQSISEDREEDAEEEEEEEEGDDRCLIDSSSPVADALLVSRY